MGGLKINNISKVLGAFTGASLDPLLTSNATSGVVDTAANTAGTLPNANIWIGSAINVPVPHLITGDITITNAGVAAIGAGVIVNTDINTSAAIDLTKLATLTVSRAVVSDSSGFITTSATTAIQIGYLSTTTSDIQTQLNSKQVAITGAASTVVTANLNPSIVVVSDGAGKIVSSTTTVAKLAFINGLTSDAQTQLNTKLTVSLGATIAGDILYYNGSAWTNFPIGGAGEVLTSTGSSVSWAAATANGLPVGGTAAQFLAKNSGVNYDASWFTLTTSLITDIIATAAQINAATSYLTVSGVPTGTTGQVLTIVGGVMGWQSAGSGTVTSVQVAGGTTGLTFSGGPITTTGTITMAGTLGVVNGGTGQTTVSTGDLLYGSALNTWSRLAATTNGFVLTLSAGVPVWAASGAGSFWLVTGTTTITGNTTQSGNFTNTFSLNRVNVNQNSQSGVTPSAFVVTGGTHTAILAGTEVIDVNFALGRTLTYATGALGTQRSVLIAAPTLAFVGASAVTDAATLALTGAPVQGTNASIANTHVVLIQAGAVGAVTNSYGLTVNAQTGGTNNYTAVFLGGNVGIGTAAPATDLELARNSAAVNIFRLSQAGAGQLELQFVRTGASASSWSIYAPTGATSFRIRDNTAAADRFSITAPGNVGIGITPGANIKLDILNAVAGSNVIRAVGIAALLRIDDGGAGTNVFGASVAHIFQDFAGNERMRILATGNVGIGTNAPSLRLSVYVPTVGLPATSGSTQTYGSVRIGTSDAAGVIDMGANGGAGSWLQATNSTDLSQKYPFLINPNGGNVGIGTPTPVTTLQLVVPSGTAVTGTTAYGGLQFNSGVDGGVCGMTMAKPLSDNLTHVAVLMKATIATGTSIHFATTNNYSLGAIERMTIVENGNVGIGTNAPSLRLSVYVPTVGLPATSGSTQTYGSVRIGTSDSAGVIDMGANGAAGSWLQATNSTDLSQKYPFLINPNGGNVGIGTTAPTSTLDVNGILTIRNAFGLGGANYGTTGQVLTSQGSSAVPIWSTVTALPAGSNTQIQFNNSGVFGASTDLTWDGNNIVLQVNKSLKTFITGTTDFTLYRSAAIINHQTTITASPGFSIQYDNSRSSGIGGLVQIIGQDSDNSAGGSIFLVGGRGSLTTGAGAGGDIFLQGGQSVGGGRRGAVFISNIPTSSAGLPSGAIWSNSGILTIV